jgi:hypothetical protein
LLIIRNRAVQAAMKIVVNQMNILNLIRAKKKVKVLMIEEKQKKRKSKSKTKLNKQGLQN